MSEVSMRPMRPAAPATISLAIDSLSSARDWLPICQLSRRSDLSAGRRGCGRRRCGFLLLAAGGVVVFLAQAAVKARLAAFLLGTGLVSRLGHLTSLPQPEMFAAIAFGDHLMVAVIYFASTLVCHRSFSKIENKICDP